MTISAFKRETYGDDSVGKGNRKNSGVAGAYRDWKREEAVQRQQLHVEDVAKTAAEQNISVKQARDVVRSRKRMLFKRDERRRLQPRARRTARIG